MNQKANNNILELRGNPFTQASKSVYGGGIYMNSHVVVTVEYLENLKSQLSKIKEFWKKEPKFFNGILISVYYNKIVAKSNRIVALFKKENPDNLIVGAKFNKQKTKHIITYFMKEKTLADSIEFISNISKILSKHFDGQINSESFKNQEIFKKIIWKEYQISKTTFQQLIADISYIEAFNIDTYKKEENNTIVTLYNVDENIDNVLKKIGINILKTNIFDNQTVLLDDKQLELLIEKAPYLISMAVEDLSSLSPDAFKTCNNSYPIMTITDPTSEPIIGVIDTAFDTNVYFNKWVEYEDMVDPNIPKNPNDCVHGTAVSSIIVDGPKLNPWLDDGCGRFRVKHFGVSRDKKFSSFTLIKEIKKIVLQNSKIKVWNLSLGSNSEIDDNFISFAGAALDKIQFENDVIFVIAGTNDNNSMKKKKIGSPADSINSIVVNSVTETGLPANYSRRGLALSFFSKPDVSYYGGSEEKMIRVCTPQGEAWRMGTSFAAPWIARKLAYLIHILGFNREVAKALIIDAARGWTAPKNPTLLGHGIVPKHINDIIQSKTDEIKFIVSDISEKWNTYNYNFPIPLIENKYPYIARATMCYFPLCNRLQGVDYTNTELNLHFGRINDSNTIVDIKNDYQNQEDKPSLKKYYIFEDEARKDFRKWDNVKCVVENDSNRSKPKKSYKYKKWGMEIKTNNRINSTDGIGIRFGIVVTIKEINGVNRINEFIKNCVLSGWLVNKIKVENKIEIHQKASENIEFE